MVKVVPRAELASYIGQDLEAGEWFLVDQQRIQQFADVTLDHQFIHIDPDKAKQTPFGGTIAHGFLTLSLLTHLTSQCALVPEEVVMGINYGFDKVRFISPVKTGAEVRAMVNILEVDQRGDGQILVKQGITVEIRGEDKPALVCEWLALYVCS